MQSLTLEFTCELSKLQPGSAYELSGYLHDHCSDWASGACFTGSFRLPIEHVSSLCYDAENMYLVDATVACVHSLSRYVSAAVGDVFNRR